MAFSLRLFFCTCLEDFFPKSESSFHRKMMPRNSSKILEIARLWKGKNSAAPCQLRVGEKIGRNIRDHQFIIEWEIRSFCLYKINGLIKSGK